MKNVAALVIAAVLAAAPCLAQAQHDFNTSLKPYKAYTAVQDNTYIKPVAVNEGPFRVMEALMSCGTDLTNSAVMMKHAKVHLDVLAGKYVGASGKESVKMLGLIGSSNSPLVGNSAFISVMVSRLYLTYSRSSDIETRVSALISIAMIANANYDLMMTVGGKSVGEWALSVLYGAITNSDSDFHVRRGAVMALASIQKDAAVKKISSCITKLIADEGNGGDDVFTVNGKGELEDEGTSGETLVASLMLGLEYQLEGEASASAMQAMKYYANLNMNDGSCKPRFGLKMPKNQYMSETTLLMARYILARGSMIGTGPGASSKFSAMYSRIEREENDYGKVFLKETGNAACLIPVVEDEGFECETRRAFNSTYRGLAGSQLSYISAADNPPVEPVNFDNCLKAQTNKIMANLALEMVTGGVVDAAVTGAIRLGAYGIKLWSLNKAYKIAAIGGKMVKASRYAKFGGAVGQYEEALIKIYDFQDAIGDAQAYAEAVKKGKK